MDFKDDTEYATAKHAAVHKAVSLGIVIAHAAFVFFKCGGGQAFRLSAWFILPLAYIWKCEDLAEWWSSDERGGSSFSDDPAGLRVIGWIMLLVFLGLRIYAYVSVP